MKGRLLLVEDDPEVLLLYYVYLTKHGFQCDMAAGGVEAIAKCLTNEYAVVFTDLNMPGMDGEELVAWLVTNRPAVRIIAASAKTRLDQLRDEAIFLSKPFHMEELLELLEVITDEQAGA